MADNNSESNSPANVIAIDSAYMQVKMPDVFVQVKERGQQGCMPLLQALFDNVDDALFEMADKADSNAAQNMYFESMREVRLKRRGMELSFIKSIEQAFTDLVANRRSESQASVSTADLALVAHDELEELMASGSLVAKAEKKFAEPLALLMARLTAVLDAHELAADLNPLGPVVICKAFVTACQSLETDINTKLVLFKLFDRYVVEELGAVYDACNETLVDLGVLPDTTAASIVARTPTPVAGGDEVEKVFEDLQALLQQAPQVNNAGQPAGQAPQIPHDSLMSLLQLVQLRVLNQPLSNQVVQLDVQQVLNDLCAERMPGQAVSIGQVEDDTINLVSMLFQFMLEDRNLAAPIKSQLARMQIPIVKVAMKDKSFFSRGGHPARKLLNAMATSALGWEEPQQVERDPLYKKIGAIVTQLLEQEQDGVEVYEQILADFNSFVELEKRRASLIEQRTLDAEDGKAKAEIARQSVKTLLQEKLSGRDLPPVVMTILQEAWSNVLFLSNLKEGENSANWQANVAVVDDLLWSVEPKSSPEDRKRLLQLIPNLLKALRTGLTQVAFNPFEMNRLFDELENLHLNQLRQPVVEPAEASEPQAEATSDSSVVADELAAEPTQTLDQLLTTRADQATLEEASENPSLMAELDNMDELDGFGGADNKAAPDIAPAAPEALNSYHQQVDSLGVGSWLEMLQDDGSKLRCRLAAIIRGTGKYIFVNRAGMKVAEHTRDSLAEAVRDGEVFLLDDGLLFDRALESVIGNLREMKSQGA